MRFSLRSFAAYAVLVLTVNVWGLQSFAAEPIEVPALKGLNIPRNAISDLAPAPPEEVLKSAAASRALPRPIVPPSYSGPLLEPQVTSQARQVLGFYGGYTARATLSQQPRRSPIQASPPKPMFRQVKPFQTIYESPSVSPYLNLHRDEANNEGAPNYFAFVRPQMEQIDANRRQLRDIQQLRGQLQGISSTVIRPQNQAAAMPGTGSASRFMDTAQFYGGLRR
jgi:hypothetical protein